MLRKVSNHVAVRDTNGDIGLPIEELCVVTRELLTGCASRLVLLSVANVRVDELSLFPS